MEKQFTDQRQLVMARYPSLAADHLAQSANAERTGYLYKQGAAIDIHSRFRSRPTEGCLLLRSSRVCISLSSTSHLAVSWCAMWSGGLDRRRWQKRWFVLVDDFLFYYSSSSVRGVPSVSVCGGKETRQIAGSVGSSSHQRRGGFVNGAERDAKGHRPI